MASETDIANLALSWLGAKSIMSMQDPSAEAQVTDANYALSRDAVLEARAWGFATERRILTPLAEPVPLWGRGRYFHVDSNVLRVFRVFRPQQTTTGIALDSTGISSAVNQWKDWRIEGENIYAEGLEVLHCLMIMRVTNPDFFSPNFIQALAAHIAASICASLTENLKLEIKMWELYENKLSVAAAAEGSQGGTDVIDSTILTSVRRKV